MQSSFIMAARRRLPRTFETRRALVEARGWRSHVILCNAIASDTLAQDEAKADGAGRGGAGGAVRPHASRGH